MAIKIPKPPFKLETKARFIFFQFDKNEYRESGLVTSPKQVGVGKLFREYNGKVVKVLALETITQEEFFYTVQFKDGLIITELNSKHLEKYRKRKRPSKANLRTLIS